MGGAASAIDTSLPDRVSWADVESVFQGHPNLTPTRFHLYADPEDQKISKPLLKKLADLKYDVFLTHNWTPDELQRNNHQRVSHINSVLKRMGLITWFDEERMHGSIVDQMSAGIQESQTVAVFVTRTYIGKVGSDHAQDNCKLEFNYAHRNKGADLMIPVLMEASLRNSLQWEGAVGFVLGGHLYVDMSDDVTSENEERKVRPLADAIVAAVKRSVGATDHMLPPVATATVVPKPEAVSETNSAHPTSSSAPNGTAIAADAMPLEEVTVADVQNLLDHLQLSKYKPVFQENLVSGVLLLQCESADEVKELGVQIAAHARLLWQKLGDWRQQGVPRSLMTPMATAVPNAVPAAASQAVVATPVATATPVHHEEPVVVQKKEPVVDYPQRIELSGMPLAFSGWNGVFTRTSAKHRGRPVYRNPPHMLLFVPIIGADVVWNGSRWILHRDPDADDVGVVRGPNSALPIGNWDDGVVCSRA